MAEKIAIIVGEHPMTANSGKQYADSGYTVSVVDCLSELDTTSMPDEIFMATTSDGVDRFAEDDKVLVTVVTDGYENSSNEYSGKAIKALVAYAYYDSEYGRLYWKDKYLSDNIEIQGFQDNKVRVYNHSTGKYTTPKVNWVSDAPVNDSLTVYAIPEKRGYINAGNGEIVIDAELNDYHKAWVFSEGLAAVMKDGKIGFINARNEVAIPFQFDYSDECRMWDFGYLFHEGYCVMTNIDGDLGLIDKCGNWVVEPVYDEIWTPHDCGYRIVVNQGKHGVLDSTGTVVYPAEYGYIDILSDGFVLTKSGRQWQVDFEGNIVQPFMFDNTYYLSYPIGYGDSGEIKYAFADFMKYEVMSAYGIMNRITGERITPAIYSDINMISNDMFEVQEHDSYDWYLLETKGSIVSVQ